MTAAHDHDNVLGLLENGAIESLVNPKLRLMPQFIRLYQANQFFLCDDVTRIKCDHVTLQHLDA